MDPHLGPYYVWGGLIYDGFGDYSLLDYKQLVGNVLDDEGSIVYQVLIINGLKHNYCEQGLLALVLEIDLERCGIADILFYLLTLM